CLVGGIQHDERPGAGGRVQLSVALVAPVHDEPVAGHAGAQRELELSQRRDVRTQTLLVEEPEDPQVGKRLASVHDQRLGGGAAVGASLLPERLLAVDEQRGAVLVCKRRRGDAPDRELSLLDARAERKEIERQIRQSLECSGGNRPAWPAAVAPSSRDGPASARRPRRT